MRKPLSLSANSLMCTFISFYYCIFVIIIDPNAINDETNPDTPLTAILSKLLLNTLIFCCSIGFLYPFDLGKSTYTSINPFVHTKLHKKVFVEVNYLFIKFMLPSSNVDIEFFDELTKNVCYHFCDFKD